MKTIARAFTSYMFLGVATALAISVFAWAGIAQAASPTVISTPATGQAHTSAVLNGSYNSNGEPFTDVRFEYGPTSALGSMTSYVRKTDPSGSFNHTLTGLSPNTTYYFRAMGANNGGPGFGSMLSFTTTSYNLPSVITTNASSITQTSAVLNGSFNGNGSPTDTWFEFANNANFIGASTTATIAQASTSGSMSANIFGLSPNTKYWFRAVAENTAGTKYGSPTLSFTTSGTPTATCTINSFSPAQPSVSSGGSTTLSWNTTGCTNASIDNGVGTASPVSSGSKSTGSLSTNTTFTLTATNGSITKTATAYVSVAGTSGGNVCTITGFSANPSSVTYGASTTLSWSTSNCTSVSIDQIGVVSPTQYGTTSTGALTYTKSYTLSANNGTSFASPWTITIGVSSGTGGTNGGWTSGGNTGGTGTVQTCAVQDFSPSNPQVASGNGTTLSWNTTGCSYVTLSGGNLGAQQYGANSSVYTGALSGTTTYTLYAYGQNSTSRTTAVYVTGGPYSYNYVCSDGTDNDGDNRTDYPSDPGCYSQYDTDESDGGSTATGASVITTAATNVGTDSARLNGLTLNITTPSVAYFEYGTNTTLGQTTAYQYNVLGANTPFYSTVSILPNTTYYFRAVLQSGSTTVRGSISSFNTPSSSVTYVGGTGTGTGGTTTTTTNRVAGNGTVATGNSATSGVLLTIINQGDKLRVGDTVEYIINYTNGTGKILSNALLTVTVPQGFTAKQATQGRMASFNSMEASLGELAPGQSGSIYLEAVVDQNAPQGDTLVSTATLAFELPDKTHDSAVAYVLNHVVGGTNSLGGLALGAGFFPTTIFGWLITIIIILALILIIRRFTRTKHAGGGHH